MLVGIYKHSDSMDSHSAFHFRQEQRDFQITEKVDSITEQRTPSVLVQPCLGAERRPFQTCASLEIDFSVPGIYIRTG